MPPSFLNKILMKYQKHSKYAQLLTSDAIETGSSRSSENWDAYIGGTKPMPSPLKNITLIQRHLIFVLQSYSTALS